MPREFLGISIPGWTCYVMCRPIFMCRLKVKNPITEDQFVTGMGFKADLFSLF